MFKGIKSAYGAGYRAGMIEPPIVVFADGTKALYRPLCPFTGYRRWCWQLGYGDGLMKRLA